MQDNNSGDNDNVVPGIKSVTKEGVETSDGQGNTDNKTPRAWVNPNVTFADFLKQNKDEEEIKMEFIPPVLMSNGQKRVVFSAEEVKKGGSAFSLQLYGYFIGTSMDYRVVNAHLRRMWWRYDLKEIVKTAAGFYLCKFKSEKGMKEVLESGPWLVNNVPFFVNQWEPGVWLEKIEPEKVPIWICIHNIPIELWSGRSIGKLVSGIGRPMLMDKVTSERCLSKSGRLGFARVLTEVNANDDLPSFVEFSYPVIGSFPAKVGKLEVTYQWKPPSCTHCKVFGHSFNTCKIRPKTEDEVSAQVLKDALKINNDGETVDLNNQCVEDGFKVVGKKGRVFQKLNFDNNKSQRQSTEAKGIKQNAVKNNYGIKDNIDVEETDWNVESQKSQNHNVLRKGDKGKGIDGEGKEVIDQWQPHEFKYFRTQWIAAGFGNFDKDGMVIGD
ncbi:uncharacterized protein [Rutidosis leptorrhynchoides]|uniref:uncharacterized protein n=1 Tax=Rutidosis leptorrhynchoides TaxID=125765 RepID=UPI003A99D351